MIYKYNVSCSETICKNWTPTAEECYYLGCNCNKCSIHKFYFSDSNYKCRMKETVIELVRKFGKPDVNKEKYNEKTKIYKRGKT